MLLAIAGPLVVVPALGAAGLFVGGSMLRMLMALLAPAAIGGMVAGATLGRGWRGRLGFAIAFPVGATIPLLAVATLPTLSGREGLIQLMIAYVGIWGLSYGALGVVGASIAGVAWRLLARVLLACAVCGVVGGLVMTGVASALTGDGSGITWLRMAGSAAALLISAAGCGWWLGRLPA